jgi:hypothetical protein
MSKEISKPDHHNPEIPKAVATLIYPTGKNINANATYVVSVNDVLTFTCQYQVEDETSGCSLDRHSRLTSVNATVQDVDGILSPSSSAVTFVNETQLVTGSFVVMGPVVSGVDYTIQLEIPSSATTAVCYLEFP